MAINFTTSYTFSPNTTISSSQVNTNFNDIASVFQGLEGQTKSFSNLNVDATPSTATNVAIKSYVDSLMPYRRPVLQYSSATVVNIENGLTGTSGQAAILFPDGNYRTDSTTSRINFDITRNAALTGTAQSGLRTGLSETTNTWYAIYAVKVQDNSANFVLVGDTVLPIQGSFSTLNSNFGTSGWVYLGLVRNGTVSTQTGDIAEFVQAGSLTILRNANAAANLSGFGFATAGIRFADQSASASTLTYTATRGTGTTDIPENVSFVRYHGATETNTSAAIYLFDSGGASGRLQRRGGVADGGTSDTLAWVRADDGATLVSGSGNIAASILLDGWVDGVLGVGANPLL